MDRNRNQEHISIRADASEILEVEKQMEVFIERCLFQFALMRVNSLRLRKQLLGDNRQGEVSIRADASELLEVAKEWEERKKLTGFNSR